MRQLAAESRSADKALKWSGRLTGCVLWIFALAALTVIGAVAWAFLN